MGEILAACLFAVGYVAITLEHKLFLNKAAASMMLAVALWVIAGVTLPAARVEEALMQSGSDIFGIVIFLLCAMTLVEILVHYHAFDVVEKWLRRWKVNLYQLGWIFAFMTYAMSTFIANLTITIVVIQLARRFFPAKYLLPLAALVVIASNVGGSFSPIGDVNTLMLWFAGKFSAFEVIRLGFVPSFLGMCVASGLLLRCIPKTEMPLECCNECHNFSHSEGTVVYMTFGAFLLPLVASFFQIPAYMGLLLGLGAVWMLIDIAKRKRPYETHLQANIKEFMQKTDIECILFFVGILLAVAALNVLGVLDVFTHALLGSSASVMRTAAAFVGFGFASSVIDNVPLTAAAISSLHNIASSLWVLLALSVTVGGSLTIIGSASGVVAMGMIKELTFGKYMKLATIPALIAFAVIILAWMAEAFLIV